MDRPSLGPRVPFRVLPDVPAEDFDFDPVVVVVLDFGRVVVVVEDEDVAADDSDRGRVVVVVDDLLVDPRAVVVVVDDLVVDFVVDRVVVVVLDFGTGFDSLVVVEVVDLRAEVVEVVAFGTLGSSLAGASSRARVGPLAAGPTSGDPGGGGIRSSRRAYCMIRENTGADT